MMTIGERFNTVKGIGPGFDHLRIGLAMLIFVSHCLEVPYGDVASRAWLWPLTPFLQGLLPMFFGLSGFLVIGSAVRTANIRVFLTFRVLRIVPALFTEIALSALILGPLVTVLPLHAYFRDKEFIAYFGSLIGRVRFTLPGVFVTNPIPIVNRSLWTVGPEILCYVILALLMLAGFYKRAKAMLFVTIVYIGVCLLGDRYDLVVVHDVLPVRTLVLAFLSGNLIYLWRDKIIYSLPLAGAAFVLAMVFGALIAYDNRMLALMYPSTLLLVYIVAVIGLTSLPPLPFFHRGDYSYGIYIYHTPIAQAIIYFFPGIRTWWFTLLLATPITMLFAVGSWHFIEKPALSLRKRLLPDPGTPRNYDVARRMHVRQWAAAAALGVYGLFVGKHAHLFPFASFTPTMMAVRPAENPTGSP